MKVIRIGIFMVIAFGVLSHGAVEPWSRAVLESASGLLLVLWAAQFFYADPEREIALPRLIFPVTAFTLLVIVQMALRLTASQFSTRIELQLLVSLVILVFLSAQAFRTAR